MTHSHISRDEASASRSELSRPIASRYLAGAPLRLVAWPSLALRQAGPRACRQVREGEGSLEAGGHLQRRHLSKKKTHTVMRCKKVAFG